MNSDGNENHPKTIQNNATNILNALNFIGILEISAMQLLYRNQCCILYVMRHFEFMKIYCASFA